jgi:hypothetical protein
VAAYPAKEELVEQLAGLERGRKLEVPGLAVGAAGEHTAALTPQAQVIDAAQGLAGVWVASFFSGVDEVEGHVSCDEGELGDWLHATMVPAKVTLLGILHR